MQSSFQIIFRRLYINVSAFSEVFSSSFPSSKSSEILEILTEKLWLQCGFEPEFQFLATRAFCYWLFARLPSTNFINKISIFFHTTFDPICKRAEQRSSCVDILIHFSTTTFNKLIHVSYVILNFITI
jgi:hypothetical protein